MSSSTRAELARNLDSLEFRRALRHADIGNIVSTQLRIMMEHEGWSQTDLARHAEFKQPLISKYLAGYANYSVATLERLADAFDVSLAIRFEPFSRLAEFHDRMSAIDISVPRYERDTALKKMQAEDRPTPKRSATAEGQLRLGKGFEPDVTYLADYASRRTPSATGETRPPTPMKMASVGRR
ncbi:MAG: helix-turn-helix transcriptional regulator [Dehalococcoidia bacterium]